MGRMHAIAHTDGTTEMVPFTEEEEKEWDDAAAAWDAGANDRAMAALRKERDRLLDETDERLKFSIAEITSLSDLESPNITL